MNVTLLGHFRDEEYLLPWWVSHHAKLFENAILFDYGSTDASVSIIRDLAPNWRVLPSRNRDFSAGPVDQEIMAAESAIDGWKICLNTTEFLVGDLSSALEMCPVAVQGYRLSGRTLVDLDPSASPSRDGSLVAQKPWGIDEFSWAVLRHRGELDGLIPQIRDNYDPVRRGRLLHRADNGMYVTGRHTWNLPGVIDSPGLEVWWFGLSPWNPEARQRKVSVANQVPFGDLQLGLGTHHQVPQAKLEEARQVLSRFSRPASVSLGEARALLDDAVEYFKDQATLPQFTVGKRSDDGGEHRRVWLRLVLSLRVPARVRLIVRGFHTQFLRNRRRLGQLPFPGRVARESDESRFLGPGRGAR
jgi:hypothetical protein